MGKVEASIDVNAPISTVYNQWTQFEEFPRFMEAVESVSQFDDTTLEWHANIRGPAKTVYAGAIFHMILTFTDQYPRIPPRVLLCTSITHPNVFGGYICLDMLQEYITTGEPVV